MKIQSFYGAKKAKALRIFLETFQKMITITLQTSQMAFGLEVIKVIMAVFQVVIKMIVEITSGAIIVM